MSNVMVKNRIGRIEICSESFEKAKIYSQKFTHYEVRIYQSGFYRIRLQRTDFAGPIDFVKTEFDSSKSEK